MHDINKLVESQGRRPFTTIAVKETIQRELEHVGVPDFFPEFLDYLEDITFLVRYHSGHYSTAGEGLIHAFNPYTLDRARLQRFLAPLMRALDVLDLSDTLEEQTHKANFLTYLNAFAPVRYAFFTHQLAEQRGLLTNLIHNRTGAYLEQHYGMVPLLFYPNGVAYLIQESQSPLLAQTDLEAIGQSVAQAAAEMSRGNFRKFIRSGNQGIKVDQECLELGVSFRDLINEIYNRVMVKVVGKRFKIADEEAKVRGRLQGALNDPKHTYLVADVQRWLAQPHLYPPTQEGMGAGELLRSYYILLSDHFKEKVGDPWTYLYTWLSIPPERITLYDLLDPRYQRAYAVVHDLALQIDPLFERLLADGESLMLASTEGDGENLLGEYTALTDYVVRNVHFSAGTVPQMDFQAALAEYVNNNHRQCCYCGSEVPTDKWMSNQAPANVTVQSFSNRLPGGGSSEPKRFVCQLCRIHFTLEKLTHQVLKKVKTVYLHLYPYTFYTHVFLQSLQDEVRQFLDQDTSVLLLRSDEAFRTFLDESRLELPVMDRNNKGQPYVNGLVLPQYTETIGNVLILPLNCPGENESEQFLFALQNALLLQRYFGCKALLTESALPVLQNEDFRDLFIDYAVAGFEGLLPAKDLDRQTLETLWNDMLALHRLQNELYNPERKGSPSLTLSRALSNGRLALYHVADRLVESKVEQRRLSGDKRMWGSIRLSQRILPDLQGLVSKGGRDMKSLEALAQMAWAERIIGRSLERNSLLRPFDMLLEGLEKKPEAFGLDTLRAQLAEDIFRHLEAIANEEYRPGRTKREKIKVYVDLFFDEVLQEIYRGNTIRLLADGKALRSAYLFYVREQIPAKEKGD